MVGGAVHPGEVVCLWLRWMHDNEGGGGGGGSGGGGDGDGGDGLGGAKVAWAGPPGSS